MKIFDKVMEIETKKLRTRILKKCCPSEFGFKNLYDNDEYGTCKGVKGKFINCDECWSQEYKESEE